MNKITAIASAKAAEAKPPDHGAIERFMAELGKPPPIMQPPPILKGACRLETLPAESLFVFHNPEKPFTLTFTLAAAADVVINPARVQAVARYGSGVRHGEGFTLTAEQIAEWSRC